MGLDGIPMGYNINVIHNRTNFATPANGVHMCVYIYIYTRKLKREHDDNSVDLIWGTMLSETRDHIQYRERERCKSKIMLFTISHYCIMFIQLNFQASEAMSGIAHEMTIHR